MSVRRSPQKQLASLLNSGCAISQGIGDVGKRQDKSIEAYNKAVASLETRLLPAARRLKDVTASEKELPELELVDHTPRLPLEG